jgi:Coenzyme PQQ synthesis protein D (PqqD)
MQMPRGTDLYRRAGGIVRHEVGVTTFLVDARRNAIHALNPVGAAVWEHLAALSSRAELAETLLLAYPGVDRRLIERDLTTLLERLLDAGLAVRCQ